MTNGHAIRGSRVGAGPMGEAERGEAAPRVLVSYWCANGHESKAAFSADTMNRAGEDELPEFWDCPKCGLPAGKDPENPPLPPKVEPYKTHLAYVKERRTMEEAETLLAEALNRLRSGARFLS